MNKARFLGDYYETNTYWSRFIDNLRKCWAGEWTNWKPQNEFQELALKLRDYDRKCVKYDSFNQEGIPTQFHHKNSKDCQKEYNSIWQYIYKEFPLIRSGEV